MKKRRSSGFTLIELLTVILIISLLAAMLIPVVLTAMRTAKKSLAINEIKNIELAFKQYIRDYSVVPTYISGKEIIDLDVLNVLSAQNTDYNANAITYMERTKADTDGLKDPWGKHYQIGFDLNYDNIIDFNSAVPGLTEDAYGTVGIWSHGRKNGREGAADDPEDDLRNWEF